MISETSYSPPADLTATTTDAAQPIEEPLRGRFPIPLRAMFGLLGIFGCVFATLAWILIPIPIGIFIPKYQFTFADIVESIAGSLLSITGYFVCVSWLLIATRGRSILRSEEVTQWVSIANHFGWLTLFPFLRRETLWQMFVSNPTLSIWLLANIVIAVACVILIRRTCGLQ